MTTPPNTLHKITAFSAESKVLAVDLTLARHQLDKVSEALRRATFTQSNPTPPAVAAQSGPAAASVSASVQPPAPSPQQAASGVLPAAAVTRSVSEPPAFAVPGAPASAAPPPQRVVQSAPPAPPAVLPAAPVPPAVPPAAPLPAPANPLPVTGTRAVPAVPAIPPAAPALPAPPPQRVVQTRTANLVGQSLSGLSDGSLPETPIDFGCGKQTNGKDRCACQIACAGGRCDNAQAICSKLEKCATMRTNNSIKKKVRVCCRERERL